MRYIVSKIGEFIGICVSLIGLLAYVVKVSISYSKLKEKQVYSEQKIEDIEKLHDLKIENLSNEVNQAKQNYNALKIIVENNSKRDEEDRQKNAEKFTELFNSRNKTNEVLTELTTTIKMMVSNIDKQFENLDKKIEEFKKEK